MKTSHIFALLSLAPTLLLAVENYQPLGHTAYTTSTFSENRGTRYHAGVDWSTEMKEGWPVFAPEDGRVIELRQSPFSYGRNVMFRANSGNIWLFAHLSGFASRLDSAFELQKIKRQLNDLNWKPDSESNPVFKQNEVLAYSGSTGIGNPHLHVELRDSTGNVVRSPCTNGVVCSDTIAPYIFGAAVWDADPRHPVVSLTSAQSLANGCIEVDPAIRKPRLALKLVDYSRVPLENPMSVYSVQVAQKGKMLFNKTYATQTYGHMARIREELLWSEESDTTGDWHSIGLGSEPNENIRSWDSLGLGKALKSSKNPIALRIEDFTSHVTELALTPQAKCKTADTARWVHTKFQDTLLYTFLARPWINLSVCDQSFQLHVLDSTGHVLSSSVCKTLPHREQPLAQITANWPKARTLEVWPNDSKQATRTVHLHPLGKEPLHWIDAGVSLKLKAAPTPYGNLVAWEKVDSLPDSLPGTIPAWIFHPKGLHIDGKLEVCIRNPVPQVNMAPKLYWLGETSRRWFLFSKQSLDSNTSCAEPDELRDLAFYRDTVAPVLGDPRDTLAMIRGNAMPVVRISVTEAWSGIPDGNAIIATVGGKWIPCEFDSEPSEIVIDKNFLTPGKPLRIEIHDEAGNKTSRIF